MDFRIKIIDVVGRASNTYFLSIINFVVNGHVRNVFFHLPQHHFRREACGSHVIDPTAEVLCRSNHDLYQGSKTIVDVNHGQHGVRPQIGRAHV